MCIKIYKYFKSAIIKPCNCMKVVLQFHTEYQDCNFTNKTFNFKLCYGGGGSGAFWGLRASIFMVKGYFLLKN